MKLPVTIALVLLQALVGAAWQQPASGVPVPPVVPSVSAALVQGGLRARAAADIAWVRSVAYAGDARFEPADFPGLAEHVELVVTLDPGFLEGHLYGALVLAGTESQFEDALALLEAGAQRFPADASFGMYRGGLLHISGRLAEAAAAYRAVAGRPGVPSYIGTLAARLENQAATCESTLAAFREFAERMPQAFGRGLRAREDTVRLECMLRELERAQARLVAVRGAPATSWPELAAAAGVPAQARDPFGGTFEVDAGGRVTTTSRRRRTFLRGVDAVRGDPP